jgi:hypothetical protein
MQVRSPLDPYGSPSYRGATDVSRFGAEDLRGRRASHRDRRRVEPRNAFSRPPADGPDPAPRSRLATIIASLSLGVPVEAQAPCRLVTAAYLGGD